MNRTAQFHFTPGFVFRLFGGFLEVFSLPFVITNPTNITAWIFFSFGNGLLAVGGAMS